MTSFKDARNLLLESYNDGSIDDDEFILLYEENLSKNPEFPNEEYELFDLDTMRNAKPNFALKKLKFFDLRKRWISLKRFFATSAQLLLG